MPAAQRVDIKRNATGQIGQQDDEGIDAILNGRLQRRSPSVARDGRVDLLDHLRKGEHGNEADLHEQHDQQMPIDGFEPAALMVTVVRVWHAREQRCSRAVFQLTNVRHGHETEEKHQDQRHDNGHERVHLLGKQPAGDGLGVASQGRVDEIGFVAVDQRREEQCGEHGDDDGTVLNVFRGAELATLRLQGRDEPAVDARKDDQPRGDRPRCVQHEDAKLASPIDGVDDVDSPVRDDLRRQAGEDDDEVGE